jgi:hypothetical protein
MLPALSLVRTLSPLWGVAALAALVAASGFWGYTKGRAHEHAAWTVRQAEAERVQHRAFEAAVRRGNQAAAALSERLMAEQLRQNALAEEIRRVPEPRLVLARCPKSNDAPRQINDATRQINDAPPPGLPRRGGGEIDGAVAEVAAGSGLRLPEAPLHIAFTAEFAGLWNDAWGADELGPDPGGAEGAAGEGGAALPGVHRVLENQRTNAAACAADRRRMRALLAELAARGL